MGTDGNASVDVVVVGLGAAGLSAAITAHDEQRSVLILEKAPPEHSGGNTRVSGQVWFSPDDVEMARTHLRALCRDYPIPEELVDAWATETAQNSAWVRARTEEVRGTVPKDVDDPYEGDGTDLFSISFAEILGAIDQPGFPADEYHDIEGAECGSNYNVIGGTMGFSRLWLTLMACVAARDIPIRYRTEVTGLLRDPDGSVAGVMVTDSASGARATIRADRGVVLASGGFAADKVMARNYLRLPDPTPWGSPSCTGDGIRLAQKVGADLAHPYNYMAMPGIRMPPHQTGEDAVPKGDRYISVGADGRRFIDETVFSRHGKASLRGDFDFHPGVPMWTIFDENGRLAGPLVLPRQMFAVGWMKQVVGHEWSLDNSAEVANGWITRADTVRELADRLGIDADGLEAQVERYNAWASSGVDDPAFGRPASTMHPIVDAPFYGYSWAQLLITTLGGIRKDEHARAVDPDGEPIPGLYCAGDVSSTYSWLLSGGMGLGDALAFGRIAGRHAAARRTGGAIAAPHRRARPAS